MTEKPGSEPINPIQYIGDVSNKSSWQTDFESLGLTARQHAAIQLRVPEAEEEWLNDMIRRARRMDFIKAAMQGLTAHLNFNIGDIPREALAIADHCLELESEKQEGK